MLLPKNEKNNAYHPRRTGCTVRTRIDRTLARENKTKQNTRLPLLAHTKNMVFAATAISRWHYCDMALPSASSGASPHTHAPSLSLWQQGNTATTAGYVQYAATCRRASLGFYRVHKEENSTKNIFSLNLKEGRVKRNRPQHEERAQTQASVGLAPI